MSGSDANYGGNRDIKKLLGNPKITFVLGKNDFSDVLFRWTSLREGNPVC